MLMFVTIRSRQCEHDTTHRVIACTFSVLYAALCLHPAHAQGLTDFISTLAVLNDQSHKPASKLDHYCSCMHLTRMALKKIMRLRAVFHATGQGCGHGVPGDNFKNGSSAAPLN